MKNFVIILLLGACASDSAPPDLCSRTSCRRPDVPIQTQTQSGPAVAVQSNLLSAPVTIIFGMAGASNMSGRGDLTEVPQGFPVRPERIMVYSNSGEWTNAVEPIDSNLNQIDSVSEDFDAGVSLGVAFADEVTFYLPRNVTVGLVPCAKGDSAAEEWLPGEDRNTLFGSCAARLREAANRGQVAGLLWHQGERDGIDYERSRLYATRTKIIFYAFREEFGYSLPIIYGQLARRSGAITPTLQYWETVRFEQVFFQDFRTRMVLTEDLPINGDGLTLTTEAQLTLGRLMADEWLEWNLLVGQSYDE